MGVAARLLAVTWMVAFGSAAEARWSVANPIPTPYEIQGFWATRSGEILAWAGGQVLRRNARAWVEEAALPDSIDFLWEDRAGDVWAVSRYTIPGVHGCWGDICEDSPERGVKVVFQRHAGHWQQTARTECSHDRRGQDPIDRLAPCELTTAERKHASEMPAPLPDHELQALWQANVGAGEGLPQKLLRGWRFAGGQVWATGRAPQSILHFDGKAWTVAANVSAADLGAVWAASQRDVWVATGRSQFPSDGQAGPALLHWDGETWHRAFESPARLFALAAAGPDDLWAVGEGGSAFHYDGYAWQAHHLPSKNLISAWAAGTGEVWASGCGDGMFRWNGHGWGQLTVPVSKNHLGVCLKLAGASRRRGTVELWGAGLTSILRSDGGSWSYAPNPIRIGALHGGEPAVPKLAYNARVNAATFAGAELWAVGEDYLDTLILHWDGARWTRTTLPGIREGLRAVWGSRADDVWAVGDHGLVLHFDGVTWSRLDAPAIKRLDGVAGADDRVWVTGAEGTLLRWDPER